MDKEKAIREIIDVANNLNLAIETKVKKDKWKADIVITFTNYKVAFNISKAPRNVKEQYSEMRKEKVCGCWLLLPSKSSCYYENEMPCFSITEEEQVCVNDKKIPFKNFIRSIIVGKVRYANIETISSVEVCFYQKECWKCHRPSYQYWVSKLISDKGVSFRLAFSEGISPTDENIANGVTQYLRALPNSNIIMGEVKPRYSKTRGQSYRSFGCPYCDSLFGEYFAMDDQMEMIYEEEHLLHAIIKLPKSFTFAVNQWYAEN